MPRDNPITFLTRVWESQPVSGYAFVSYFDEEHTFHDTVYEGEIPNEGRDIYFAPCLFRTEHRRKDAALPGRWLYADLDEVDPRELDDLVPTIAWETSPHRYQALWELERALKPEQLSALNQRVTYYTHADRGGWSLTKVLRVPGTLSMKRDDPFRVHTVWNDGPVHSARDVLELVRHVAVPAQIRDVSELQLPKASATHILRKRSVRGRALKLFRATEATGDRSARLWELENLLLDAGLSPEEVLAVVRVTVWNKYAGESREIGQLWTEVNKAAENAKNRIVRERKVKRDVEKQARSNGRVSGELAPIRLTRYLGQVRAGPRWLVERVWGREAHGIWAGDYKTYKSTLLMDLAVSVATGKPFLDKFEVKHQGRVLYVQEENSHSFMHDRLHRIVQAKGMGSKVRLEKGRGLSVEFGPEIPVDLLNLTGFNLTRTDDLQALARYCQRERPVCVILDPLYRLAPGVDENSAREMGRILHRLAQVSEKFGCALILAHHYNKPSDEKQGMRRGHRISGTGVFSRWWESSVYVERKGQPNDYTIRFNNEHREHAAGETSVVKMGMNEDDPDAYDVLFEDVNREEPSEEPARERRGRAGARDLAVYGLVKQAVDESLRTGRPIPVAQLVSRVDGLQTRSAQRVLEGRGFELKKRRRKGGLRVYAYPPNVHG